jgi:hypothetical protein
LTGTRSRCCHETEGRSEFEANDGQIVRAAALKHLGIQMQPMTILHEDVVARRPPPGADARRVGAAPAADQHRLPDTLHLPVKVRCFVDLLVEQLAELDFESGRGRREESRRGGVEVHDAAGVSIRYSVSPRALTGL